MVGSALLAALLTFLAWRGGAPFYFAAEASASEPVTAQLFYDLGRGVLEADSSQRAVPVGEHPKTCRFPLPAGELRGLRLDPADRGGVRLALADLRVTDRGGRVLRRFDPAALGAAQAIEGLRVEGATAWMQTAPDQPDPILSLAFGEPLTLRDSRVDDFVWVAGRFTMLWLGLGGLLAVGRFGLLWLWWALAPRGTEVARRVRRHPRWAVVAVGILATALSCYPVIFAGRSFVSPNNHPGTFLLYDRFPTLPGYGQRFTEDPKGADLGACVWQGLPYAAVQHRALTADGEWPLWNRFNTAGTPLLGQGISMFGDPLHFPVIFSGGASWAWDLKFVLAKGLFAVAVGLGVLAATGGHLPAALLLASSAPFLGFFGYRFSHPAFFSLCYAPLILLAWLEIVRSGTMSGFLRWMGVLLLASWMELTSGTIKEAYMLLASLHIAGLLLLVFGDEPRPVRWRKFGGLALAGVGFLLVSAPVWTTFLGALGLSATTYAGAVAYQIQPGLLLGLFDDAFYARLNPAAERFNPSANGLVLVGVLLAFASLRVRAADGRFVALALGAAGPFALVYGLVPVGVIASIPFLSNVYHLDNTFSCALIVLAFPLAGIGLRALAEARDRAARRALGGSALILLVVLTAAYVGFLQAGQRAPAELIPPARGVVAGPWFFPYAVALLAAVAVWPLATWAGTRGGASARPVAVAALAACWLVLHARHGMHLFTGDPAVDAVVVNPQPRVNLQAVSPALKLVQARAADPATGAGPTRTVGVGENFFPGYDGIAGLETIYGTDPLMNPRYNELLAAGGLKQLGGWRWLVARGDLPGALPLLNLLNVRFLLDSSTTAPAPLPPLRRLATLDLCVDENPAAWPRAFFTDRLERVPDVAGLVRRLREGDGRPFAVASAGDPNAPPAVAPTSTDPAARVVVPARDYRLTNNATAFTVEAPGPGVVVLTETFLEGEFDGRINGVSTAVFRVNHAFKGVWVPAAGRHAVSLTYRPRRFHGSLGLAGVGVALWVAGGGLAVYVARRRRSRPVPGQTNRST